MRLRAPSTRRLSLRTGLQVLCVCVPTAAADTVDIDAVYPRNCGVEGPVDLFELEPMAIAEFLRAGDHYLVLHVVDGVELEHWAVDRCGEERVLRKAAAVRPSPMPGVAGDYVVVEGCRVVPRSGPISGPTTCRRASVPRSPGPKTGARSRA